MKNILFLLFLSLGMAACQKDAQFKLQANLEGTLPDTLWVIYDDPSPKIDTIYPENGSFSYTVATDTFQLCRILSPQGESYPIFIYPKWHVKWTGSLQQLGIEGDGANGEYGEFLHQLTTCQDSATIQKLATQFVQTHLQSYASAYIISQYFIQNKLINTDSLHTLIAPLDGNVKDCYLLNSILKEITPQKQTSNSSEYVSYFSSKDRNGKYISWNSNADSYTLINFWASWDTQSLTVRDSLEALTKKLPEKQFRVLNISLDYDKKEWLDACKKDNEQWIEICDYKAWENQVIKQNRIRKLPANILVDRNRKIVAKDLYGKELLQKAKELTTPKKDH